MSKGTRIYPFRLPEHLVELAQATIRLRGGGKDGNYWTLSDFIRIAIAEKVAKMNRSRKRAIGGIAADKREFYLHQVARDPNADPDAPLPAVMPQAVSTDEDEDTSIINAGVKPDQLSDDPESGVDFSAPEFTQFDDPPKPTKKGKK